MIQELVNYAEWLKSDFSDLFTGDPEVGLHILISLTNDQIANIRLYNYKKKGKEVPQPNDENKFVFAFKEQIHKSKAISANKCIHSDKYILSNNPFCYILKLVTKTEFDKDFHFDDISKNGKIRKRKILNHSEALENQFVVDYDEETKLSAEKVIKVFQELAFDMIKSIIAKDNGEMNFKSDEKYVQKIIETITLEYLTKEDLKNSKAFFKRLQSVKIILYFDVAQELYDQCADVYLTKRGGLKKSIDTIHYNNTEYTLNSFINNANEKKRFLKHLTAFHKYNYYHKKQYDELLEEFKSVMKLIPNPLPMFIVKSELNDKVIKIYKGDKTKGYKEIIAELFQAHKDDLNNYYLFNGNRSAINDFDYVSSFDYELTIPQLSQCYFLFNINVSDDKGKIKNIFDLEKTIAENFLFKIDTKSKKQFAILANNYFSDKLEKGAIPSFIANNMYKYRKLLYDAFYKSRLHLISPKIFKDICAPVIRYEIAHDETQDGYSKNGNRIKKKLLLYIQLNKLFDENNNNFGGIDMPSALPEYYNNLLCLLREEKDYYESDEDFAFATGQLIRYLLDQSESGNKNHSMLDPFLQKLRNFNSFIAQLTKTLKSYAYKIKMNYNLFDKMMSNTMSYKLENGKSLKDLEFVLISGYFAQSAIYQVLREKKEAEQPTDKQGA
jgi:CRISPR-associated protein Csh1